MRISDWSSDVCSSDLARDQQHRGQGIARSDRQEQRGQHDRAADRDAQRARLVHAAAARNDPAREPAAEQAAEHRADEGHPGEEAYLLDVEAEGFGQKDRKPRTEEPPDGLEAEERTDEAPALAIAQQIAKRPDTVSAITRFGA